MSPMTTATRTDGQAEQAASAIDARFFREVLGHYPTGVVVVTALVDDEPVGMVIGSFTSVSLDPPLIAYLPTRTSRTFERLRRARTFCVNVLAADQEAVCRQFATSYTDKFAGIGWRPGPSGAPVIDGVVAWIECAVEDISDAGDHHIVLGRITDMAVELPTLPLMFFQGGYGRFTPGSLVIPTDREFIGAIGQAERARQIIERLAEELGVECSVVVPDRGDTVFAATANSSPTSGGTRLGARVPITAPLGVLFVDAPGRVSTAQWTAGLADEERESALQQIRRVRRRGWSLTFYGPYSQDELDTVVTEYTSKDRTPAQERRFHGYMKAMAEHHEPEEILADACYDVLHIGAPVVLDDGLVPMVLRLGELPRQLRGHEVIALADRLTAEAAKVAELL